MHISFRGKSKFTLYFYGCIVTLLPAMLFSISSGSSLMMVEIKIGEDPFPEWFCKTDFFCSISVERIY